MGFRDRFSPPATARAVLSWRILLGVGVAAGSILAGLHPVLGVLAGAITYAALVRAAMPRTEKLRIDPFTVQEPWRQFVQGVQRSETQLHLTIDGAAEGPIKDRMRSIADKLDHGMREAWRIARHGHEIDDAVTRLDPTALRSRLETLRTQPDGSTDNTAAIASVKAQLDTVDRLKARSTEAAGRLRLTQARLDELVARAAEVSIGTGDTDRYEHDVDDLVVELEGLRLAIEEIRTA